MSEQRELKYIDLFAGAGGLSLGLHNAGFKGLFAVEKNDDAFATLKFNLIDKEKHFDWPEWLPKTTHDICELVDKYKIELESLRDKVDLIVGGPPCQGFSSAGQRDHQDVRNTMVHYYLEVIRLVRPKYIMLENVRGFTMRFKEDSSKVPYSDIVVKKLKDMNYSVETEEIRMSDYTVPQSRVRFILIGSLNDDISDFFQKLKSNVKNFAKEKGIPETNNVKDAIADLLKSNGSIKCDDCNQNFQSGVYGESISKYQSLMRNTDLKNPNSHRFAKHTLDIEELHKRLIKDGPVGKRITPKDKTLEGLRRRSVTLLDPNESSPTITSNPDGLVHYCEPRILSVREFARLQSFPDYYEFKGKYTTGGKLRRTDVPRYTQVANAVPPLFAEQIGTVFKEIIK